MVSNINNYIKLFPNCNTSNRFKKPKVKKKNYWKWNSLSLYCDLWHLPKDILKDTSYKYILDRVETIFPNCFKDILLNQKKEKKF